MAWLAAACYLLLRRRDHCLGAIFLCRCSTSFCGLLIIGGPALVCASFSGSLSSIHNPVFILVIAFDLSSCSALLCSSLLLCLLGLLQQPGMVRAHLSHRLVLLHHSSTVMGSADVLQPHKLLACLFKAQGLDSQQTKAS